VRTIYPRNTYRERGYLYTVAYCDLPNEIRHFRNDRIVTATCCFPALGYFSSLANGNLHQDRLDQNSLEVQVRLSGENRLLYSKRTQGYVLAPKPMKKITFLLLSPLNDPTWLVKALIALPGSVEIVAPTSFRDLFVRRQDRCDSRPLPLTLYPALLTTARCLPQYRGLISRKVE
jgi:predicted DNA-binding transcriptional regulator YafY